MKKSQAIEEKAKDKHTNAEHPRRPNATNHPLTLELLTYSVDSSIFH